MAMKKRRGKILCLVMVATLILTSLSSICFADYETDGYELIYYNSFDNGGSDAVETTNEYGKFVCGAQVKNTATLEGQTGIYNPQSGAYPGTVNQVGFEFTNPVGEGFLIISYDIALKEYSAANDLAFNGINMTNQYVGCRVMYWSKAGGYGLANGYTESWTGVTPVELNKIQHVKIVFDYVSSKTYLYVNNEKVGSPNAFGEISNFKLTIPAFVSFFDNFKIEHYKTMPMDATITDVTTNGASVAFSDEIKTSTLEGEYSYKNLFTGEEIPANFEYTTATSINVIPEKALEEKTEYLLTLPVISGKLGGSLTETTASLFIGEGNLVKGIRFVDAWNNEAFYEDENKPELKGILIKFTDEVNATTAIEGVTLKENSKNFPVTTDNDGLEHNEILVVPSSYLCENSDYVLSIPNSMGVLDEPFSFSFKTGKGMMGITKVEYFINDIKVDSLSYANIGDKVSAKVEYAKTINEEKEFLASATLWNGLDMNDYDYEVVSLGLKKRKYEKEFEFNVTNNQDLKLKVFMWNGLTDITPISTEITK